MSGKPPALIFDVDGTLADTRPFRHLVVGPRRNFTRFHQAACAEAQPNRLVVASLRSAREAGLLAFILTGRDEKWSEATLEWLDRHGIEHDGFCARPAGDNRPDDLVKGDALDWIGRHHHVIGACDDRPRVIQLWHRHGLRVTIVGGWFGDTDPRQHPPMHVIPPGGFLPGRYAHPERSQSL